MNILLFQNTLIKKELKW